MATPGLTLGPQDIDAAGDLTKRLGVHNKADRLLKRHAALYPQELTIALARPIDPERTDALDYDEVTSALSSLRGRKAFFDGDEDELEHAVVRGDRPSNRVVAVVYRTKSGRSARGVIPYEGLEASQRAYEAAKAEKEGRVLSSPVTTDGTDLTGAAAELEARNAELEQAAREAEERARQAQQDHEALLERLERLENPEPWDGYDALDADAVIERITEGGRDEFGRGGLERIQTYESERKNRKTVLRAVETATLAESPGGDG